MLVKELIGLHCKRVETIRGGASFAGEYADGLRVCLWSRVATRVLMEITRASAHSADTLCFGFFFVDIDKSRFVRVYSLIIYFLTS